MAIDLANGYLLRPWDEAWQDGDKERFVALADDYDVWKNLRDRFPRPYTRADAEAWVASQSGQDPVTTFAICDAAGPIGGIGLEVRTADYRHSAELGYWLGQPFWGRGIVTAAVEAATAYGFETLGLLRIDAHLKAGNGASARVLEKVGYQREGLLRHAALKEGALVDYLLFAVLRKEWHS